MTDNEQQPIINPDEEASDEEFRAAMQAAEAAARVDDANDAPTTADHITALDSLQANEFVVEIEGEPIKGVFRVSGLTTFLLNAAPDEPQRVVLAKMVQRDATTLFNAWLRETLAAGGELPTRTLAIVAIDDGEETRRWTLSGAYITSVRYSDFDTSSSDFVEEIVTVAYQSLSEAWTWSDAQ